MPDMPNRDNPGAIEALNVYPRAGGGYTSFRSHLPDGTGPAPGTINGAIVVFDDNSEFQLYAATVNGVYLRDGTGNYNQVLNTSATPVDANHHWHFPLFGEQIIAVRYDLFPHAATVGGGPFSLLGGNPPKAACGARVGDFLVLGNLAVDPGDTVGTGPFPRRIRWSGFGNIDAPWVTDPATQADFNDMPAEGGRVVGITGREFGAIFQERMISRMTYVGPPTIFDIETVEADRGAMSNGCLIDMGGNVFFIAEDGFFLWNGTEATPIGDNKVNRWFYSQLNYAERQRIVGAVNHFNGCVMWAFPGGVSKHLTDVIIYSYRMGRWSHAKISMEYMLDGFSVMLSLDAYTDVPMDDMASWPNTLDASDTDRPSLAGFNTDHKYGFFGGTPQQAILDTAEVSGPNGERWFVNSVRPAVDVPNPVVQVQMMMRDQLMGDTVEFDPPVVQEITGECPVLGDARYMRTRVIIPEGSSWTVANGVEVYRKSTGRV